jgi:adenosylcobinamide amidohydrolase
MTSRREHASAESAAAEGNCHAWAVGTMGFSNALRVGDPTGRISGPGTVNLAAFCSQPLTPEAATELIAVVSEAKTLATLEAGIPSIVSGEPSTGTGTDYLAVAWPPSGQRIRYAGKHTEAGAAVGRAAFLAVSRGIEDWRRESGRQP